MKRRVGLQRRSENESGQTGTLGLEGEIGVRVPELGQLSRQVGRCHLIRCTRVRKTDRVQINALNHSPTVWVQCPLGPRHLETRVRGSLKGKKNRILEGGAGAGSRTGGVDGWDNRDRSPSVFPTIPSLRRLERVQADLG